MNKTNIFLSCIALLLGVWAAVLWLPPFSNLLIEGSSESKNDSNNVVSFSGYPSGARTPSTTRDSSLARDTRVTSFSSEASASSSTSGASLASSPRETSYSRSASRIPTTDLRTIARSNPFYSEAAKILQGKLSEPDAQHRHVILNYCEHFRAAYTTKDIDFLRQVFSDDALIIVGNVVKPKADDDKPRTNDSKVTYAIHTKKDYLARLKKVFDSNKRIDVRFSDFKIYRHPTRDGIYGVTLRQKYKSDRYEDDGWLFLLWDFSNPSMPVIHVRTWQPAKTVSGSDDIIDLSDFNLE